MEKSPRIANHRDHQNRFEHQFTMDTGQQHAAWPPQSLTKNVKKNKGKIRKHETPVSHSGSSNIQGI
jgi:hypothetical protein